MKHINQKNDLKMNWKKKKKFCFENSRSRYLSSKTIGCKLNIYYAQCTWIVPLYIIYYVPMYSQ